VLNVIVSSITFVSEALTLMTNTSKMIRWQSFSPLNWFILKTDRVIGPFHTPVLVN
jgi:hypothetical protein